MLHLKVFIALMSVTMSLSSWSKPRFFDSEEPAWKGLFSYKGEYIVGNMGSTAINYNRVTHILVAGSAKKKESNQFFQSAVARGHKYKELYPNHQVVIISSPEVKRKENEQVYKDFNIRIEKIVKKSRLTGSRLITEMLHFGHIASFDYYGHSSPWALILGKRHTALYADSDIELISKLSTHFTPLASASLNGCNGGLKLAPFLSNKWKIPVSGALSGSLFERVHDDGHWYNEFIRSTDSWVRDNRVSYEVNQPCEKGTCWRMKPSPAPYSGYWGQFKYGLGYYKFFCNFEDVEDKCAKASALSLLSFPSVVAINKDSSLDDFKTVVYDYLCPTGRGIEHFKSCIKGINQALASGDHTYHPFKGEAISCSHKNCFYELKCKERSGDPKPGSCLLKVETSKVATTFIDDFLMLIKGFKQL